MKFYLASRTRHTAKMVYLAKYLETKGHTTVSDWIYIDEQLKPFSENKKRVSEIAEINTKAMLDADIFLMFNDLTGTDIFTEMGICIANKILNNTNMKLYVVGDYDKTSLMQFHLFITHFKNLKEVFELEKIDYASFEFPEIN